MAQGRCDATRGEVPWGAHRARSAQSRRGARAIGAERRLDCQHLQKFSVGVALRRYTGGENVLTVLGPMHITADAQAMYWRVVGLDSLAATKARQRTCIGREEVARPLYSQAKTLLISVLGVSVILIERLLRKRVIISP